MSSAATEALDLAALAGLVLDPWEVLALEDALGVRPDGKWSAVEVGLIVPRQNGKGAVLEARELAGLFLFGERLILHTAHEFKTATEAFRRIRELIESTPDLDREVFKMLQNNNDMSIETMSGQRLRFIARSGASGRGFSGDCVILDEAYELPAESIAALLPTLSARPNPQVWYTSSAPKQSVGSDVLRKFCRRGRKGLSPSLAYIEYSADPECDLDDPVAWGEANPNLGVRITEEFIRDVERGALGDEFARERLGIWDDSEGGERVIPHAAWAACESDRSGPVGPVMFGLSVAEDRSWSAIAVAAASGLGGVHVELTGDGTVLDYRPGTDWVVGRAKELLATWGGKLGVAAGSPAASLLVELEASGVAVVEVSTTDHAQACGGFYDAVMQHTLHHLGQPALTVAAVGADRKPAGDAWVWSLRKSPVEASPVVAATLAKWLHDQYQPVMAVPEAFIL